MPKRSDAEWQALDACIAQEVMGLKQACIDDDLCWVTPTFNYRYLVCDSAILRVEPEYKVWQPHKDVAQAMQTLDEMSSRRKGIMHNWFYRIQSYPQVTGHLYNVFLHTGIYPRHSQAPLVLEYSADAYILTHAICLAVEQVMNTQKEEIQGAQED